MRKTLRAVGVVWLVGAGVLVGGGTASAAPAPSPGPACSPAIVSRDLPADWVPRSPRDAGKRLTWEQVDRWDGDGDGRLSDREVRAYRDAGVQVRVGPACAVPAPAPAPPPAGPPRPRR